MASTESDPLIVRSASGSALNRGTARATFRRGKRKSEKRSCVVGTIIVAVLAFVLVGMMTLKNASDDSGASASRPTSVLGKAQMAKSRVRYDETRRTYQVDWKTTTIDHTTTFSDLATIMLLPWYEASMMAVLEDTAWDSKGGILPNNISHIRRCLLNTRNMLDVFSPVFPSETSHLGKDKSLWKKLRKLYKNGYEIAGELHDLVDVTYSNELLAARVKALTDWKNQFVAFQKAHEIRRFLYKEYSPRGVGGIDPNGCYYHKASHLFWEENKHLPKGNDPGIQSLEQLLSLQLEHSLAYLEISKNYTTVMPKEHELNFHNLRKELRIFAMEYFMFESVLGLDDDLDGDDDQSDDQAPEGSVETMVEFLDRTQVKIGSVHDEWTKHDVYVTDGASQSKLDKSAAKTDVKWLEFLQWQDENDLKGKMQYVLDRLQE